MIISYQNALNKHLTMPDFVKRCLITWHNEEDFAAINVNGKDHLWYKGELYFGRNEKAEDDFWHPSQLVIDLCRMARTKRAKLMAQYVTTCNNVPATDLDVLALPPCRIPEHLSVRPEDHHLITGFWPTGFDILSFRLDDGTELIRINGEDVDVTDDEHIMRHGAANLIEYWFTSPVAHFIKDIRAFVAEHPEANVDLTPFKA